MARVAAREPDLHQVPPPMRETDAVEAIEASKLEEIARRAYARFQMRGGVHGHDQEDWFAAEREVNAPGTD